MGLEDRDYMHTPGNQAGSGGGFTFDSGLLLGIVLIGLGFGALIFMGFKSKMDEDNYLAELAYYDPEFNGGYPHFNVNTATRDELTLLPWMSDKIADGIITRREKEPFRLTEELLEVPGVGELNYEMFRLYLYGFEDSPKPRPMEERPLGIPDA